MTQTQTWNAAQYAQTGRFVADLAGGVFDLLDPQPGEHILDLGCGDGALTEKIAATGASVAGVDASPSMIAAAQARGLTARVLSAESLDYKEEFDAVFSNAALHWMRDQDAVLRGVRQALRPGGRFVAEFGGHGNIAAVRVALRAALGHQELNAEEAEHNYFPTAESYAARLERNGFRVESIGLIARPTLLPVSGMRGWLETFRRGVLDRLPEQERERVLLESVELLRPVLCDDRGQWTADYVRLRFKAIAAG
ncbi:class I SAM-dependent methyltransferase [Paracidobacterium acidisoli]|uniref:SAM-dependent methyltransferase n=1 Tax=Paracidobacterium acidisoli TaxID=2303751 RepID=A0A372ITQ8_9BACT|nr:class I SAM-dependent methyltransferase [Paracidobacterium acidisoli]MBT9329730.1 methyltransferase domain-containing protein [Paracidobacterium acidisoli]